MSESEARQRRPPKPELPVDLDKEKLKKAFDISHFDLNAVLRGVELTLVGGAYTCLHDAPDPPATLPLSWTSRLTS